jgi:hypothetical protein
MLPKFIHFYWERLFWKGSFTQTFSMRNSNHLPFYLGLWQTMYMVKYNKAMIFFLIHILKCVVNKLTHVIITQSTAKMKWRIFLSKLFYIRFYPNLTSIPSLPLDPNFSDKILCIFFWQNFIQCIDVVVILW